MHTSRIRLARKVKCRLKIEPVYNSRGFAGQRAGFAEHEFHEMFGGSGEKCILTGKGLAPPSERGIRFQVWEAVMLSEIQLRQYHLIRFVYIRFLSHSFLY